MSDVFKYRAARRKVEQEINRIQATGMHRAYTRNVSMCLRGFPGAYELTLRDNEVGDRCMLCNWQLSSSLIIGHRDVTNGKLYALCPRCLDDATERVENLFKVLENLQVPWNNHATRINSSDVEFKNYLVTRFKYLLDVVQQGKQCKPVGNTVSKACSRAEAEITYFAGFGVDTESEQDTYCAFCGAPTGSVITNSVTHSASAICPQCYVGNC